MDPVLVEDIPDLVLVEHNDGGTPGPKTTFVKTIKTIDEHGREMEPVICIDVIQGKNRVMLSPVEIRSMPDWLDGWEKRAKHWRSNRGILGRTGHKGR